jgi:hypothetical protein
MVALIITIDLASVKKELAIQSLHPTNVQMAARAKYHVRGTPAGCDLGLLADRGRTAKALGLDVPTSILLRVSRSRQFDGREIEIIDGLPD